MSDSQTSMPPRGTQPQPKRLTVCGVVGVVFGALGLLLSFIPIINNFAAVLGVIGTILAIVALVGTFRGKKHGKAVAIVAATLSVLAVVITLAMQSATSKALDEAFDGSSSTSSTTDADGQAKGGDTAKASGTQDMEGDVDSGNYHVKLVSVSKTGADYEGKATVVLTYELTNNKTENSNFMDVNVRAFQNGRQLDTAIFAETPEGYDAGSSMKTLQPGATGTVTSGYVLEDDGPVTIEVTGTLDTGDAKVAHEFTLQ